MRDPGLDPSRGEPRSGRRGAGCARGAGGRDPGLEGLLVGHKSLDLVLRNRKLQEALIRGMLPGLRF